MSTQQTILSGRRRHSRKRGHAGRGPILKAAFAPPGAGGAAAIELPGLVLGDVDEDKRRAWKSALISLFLHFGGLVVLLIIAAVTRVIPEDVLPVQLIHDDTPPEAAPAPKAIAERSSPNFNPVAAIQPRVVPQRVVARAATHIQAQAFQMDSVSPVQAPTQVQRSTAVVERVAAVESQSRIRATTVNVREMSGPVVRGPIQVSAPTSPNAGPRQVIAARTGDTSGVAPTRIGGTASPIESGIVTGRDVEGAAAGIRVANVDTQIGDGYLGGSGGSGNGVDDLTPAARTECFQRSDVNRYLVSVKDRTIARWVLPPGLSSDQSVTLNFRIDAAGSATRVSVVRASDNALGASAVDALRTAAPFPPMDEDVRCLAGHQIRATFTNPTGN